MRRAVDSEGGLRSRLDVLRRLLREQLECVLERRPEDGEAVPYAAGRSREVDHERRTDDSGGRAREETVRSLRDRVRADRLRDTWSVAVDDVSRRLGGHVARRHARSPRRDDEPGLPDELADGGGDRVALVRD